MNDELPSTAWTKGLLPFLVLSCLRDDPAHGYAIAQEISGAGLGPIKGGVLYPVLNRLEGEGAIEGAWSPGVAGPGRKSFSLTDVGRLRLAALQEEWTLFSAAVDRFSDGSRPATTVGGLGKGTR